VRRDHNSVTGPETEEVHMSAAVPQAQGLKRTVIQEHELSVPGRVVIQNRVDISPDAPLFRHKHPGEEVIYVLEGSLQYEIDGQPPTRVSAGEGLMVPADTVHAVKNIGTGNAAELATYIVEKGKPLLVAVD
jgi:quercetin dioxygenase-like cupin family protein